MSYFPWTKHMPAVPVVGVENEGRILICSWDYLNKNLPFIELPWELLALCWFSVVNVIGNANAWPDNLGTSPMAHGGSNGNRSEKRKGGIEPRSWAPNPAWVWRKGELTRDGKVEPNSQDQTSGANEDRKNSVFPVSADHKQDWQPWYPVDTQSAKSDG